jgi:hypothetical protein
VALEGSALGAYAAYRYSTVRSLSCQAKTAKKSPETRMIIGRELFCNRQHTKKLSLRKQMNLS